VVYAAGWSNSGTDISGVPLQLLNTRYQSLGLEGQWLQAQAATFAGYTYTLGDVTSADARQFGISRVQLRHNRDLPDAWSLWGTASGQWSGDVLLPSNQQYYIGGEGSVRGYATGLLSGDEGYTLSVELRRPLPLALALPDGQPVNASAFVFVDYGRVYPFRPPGSVLPAWQQLTGTGVGVRAALGRQFYGTFTAAYGLNDVPLQPRPYALTFQLSVAF
jgi:hemolysin activation/secretion protein